MDMPYFAIVYAANREGGGDDDGQLVAKLVAMVTCVVFEPDGVEVEGRGQVKDVRVTALQQVGDDQLRPGTGKQDLSHSS